MFNDSLHFEFMLLLIFISILIEKHQLLLFSVVLLLFLALFFFVHFQTLSLFTQFITQSFMGLICLGFSLLWSLVFTHFIKDIQGLIGQVTDCLERVIIDFMGKKNLTKSEKQLQILVDYYQSSDGLWEREQLEILAEKLDLTRQQVYKWLWDQKKIQVKKSMNEGLLREEGVNKKDDSMEDQNQQFTYGNGIGKIRASSRIQQAVEFIVHTSVSSWAMNVLRNEGWQFVMESSRNTNLDEVVHIFDEEMMEVEEQIQIKEEEFQPVLQEIQVPEMKGLVKQEEQDFQMILVELNPPEVKQFEVVNEDIQPDFPFLKVKAKEEEMFDDDLSWRSVKRYILNKEKGDSDVKGKKRQKIVMKDIASSEEIFDSKS